MESNYSKDMVVYSEAVMAAWRSRTEREAMQIHVVSYGGSGTVFFSNWLHAKLRIRTQTGSWHALLNHYAVPIDLGIPRVCLMADPPTAYLSVRRRSLGENVTRHMHGGQYGQCQIKGMEEFFDRWTVAPNLIFCKYEALYDNIKKIAEALKINFRLFPPQRIRLTPAPTKVNDRLLALREKFDALPNFFISESQQSFQFETRASSAP